MNVVTLTLAKRRDTLEGHEAELDKLVGETATVNGNATGETVAVESVAPAKKG